MKIFRKNRANKQIQRLAKLKVLILSGKLTAENVGDLIEISEEHPQINLIKSPVGWYLEEIADAGDIFEVVEKVCIYSKINFYSLNQKDFFKVLKSIKVQGEVIAKIINDIKYPELSEIQKEAGYGSKSFGTAGVICNLAAAFQIDYLTAEKQPIISLTKLRMDAHVAMCRDKEDKIKKLLNTK